jgi:hypothetical protein
MLGSRRAVAYLRPARQRLSPVSKPPALPQAW